MNGKRGVQAFRTQFHTLASGSHAYRALIHFAQFFVSFFFFGLCAEFVVLVEDCFALSQNILFALNVEPCI